MIKRLWKIVNPMRILRYCHDLRKHAGLVSERYGVPVRRIAAEQICLFLRNDMRRDEYYRYHLFDPALSWLQKRAFVSDNEIRRIQRALTPGVYIGILKNKLVFHKYFKAFQIPLPELVAVFDPQADWQLDVPCLRNADDLHRWLPQVPTNGVVFKPVEGDGGQSILVFYGNEGKHADRLSAVDGRQFRAVDLAGFMTSRQVLTKAYDGGDPMSTYLVERRIDQHETLSELCPNTVCTVRVVTLYCNNKVDIIGAVFKLPTTSCGIDNLHTGGLGVGITDGGVLKQGRSMNDMWLPYRSELPSGIRFEGVQLPYWDEVLAVAKRAACAFPHIPAVGWDIAISKQGPVVIEGNWGWGADVIQIGNHSGIMCDALAELYGRPTGAVPCRER